MAQPSPLRDMVKQAHDNGQSYADLAAHSVDPDTGVHAVPSYLHRIAAGKAERIPSVPHLRAIAAGLGVPYEQVRQAAIAQWMPPDPEEVRVMQAEADRVFRSVEALAQEIERKPRRNAA